MFQLTTCRIGNLTRLIHTLAICVTIHTYTLRSVCAFVKLHITAQSGPGILVILCDSHRSCVCVCVCVCVCARASVSVSVCLCVFIELYISPHSGPAILVILCPSHLCVCASIKLHMTTQSGPVCVCIYLLNGTHSRIPVLSS